jgi:S-(hydroxymethyl)glutathione dehydrogenase/alcohol dehydrogenase
MTLLGTSRRTWTCTRARGKIDPTISFEVAALVGCGAPPATARTVRSGDIRPVEDVAIVGIGGVGMGRAAGRVNAGAPNIFASTRSSGSAIRR